MESGRSNSMLGMSGSASGIGSIIHQTNRISKPIRVVHIIAPKIIKTDQANFRALVQKLTGKHSRRSSRKSMKKKCNKKIIDDDGHHFFGKTEFACYDDQFTASLSQIKEESVNENSMSSFNSFSFGGTGEIDFFTALSMLPEFPTMECPMADHTDSHSGIFGTSEGAGEFALSS